MGCSCQTETGDLTCVQRQQGFVQVAVELQRVDVEDVTCWKQRCVLAQREQEVPETRAEAELTLS